MDPRNMFWVYLQQSSEAGFRRGTHQVSVVFETGLGIGCGCFLSSRNFRSLGRELGTRRRHQVFGEGFFRIRNCLQKMEGLEVCGVYFGSGLREGTKLAGKGVETFF